MLIAPLLRHARRPLFVIYLGAMSVACATATDEEALANGRDGHNNAPTSDAASSIRKNDSSSGADATIDEHKGYGPDASVEAGPSYSIVDASTDTRRDSTPDGQPSGDTRSDSGQDARQSDPDCDYTGNTCATAIDEGTMSGDSGTENFHESRASSAWLKVRLTEDNNWATDLSFRATLRSPAGMEYNLYVYDACNGNLYGSSTNGAGQVNVVEGRWGDSWGDSDDRDVFIEIRYASGGVCGSAAKWELDFEGNPQ